MAYIADKRRTVPSLSPPLGTAGAKLMEAMMRDEIFDRDYQAGRDALHDGIDRLIAGIGRSLKVLYSLQFDAPWKNDAEGASTRPAR
jgi:hypothetical protein